MGMAATIEPCIVVGNSRTKKLENATSHSKPTTSQARNGEGGWGMTFTRGKLRRNFVLRPRSCRSGGGATNHTLIARTAGLSRPDLRRSKNIKCRPKRQELKMLANDYEIGCE